MIVNEEFLSKLRRVFDLNLYEVKLWTALLSRGVSTAGELSDMADVPRSRTYDVLESLERKGFIIVKPEKPIGYMAIAPDEVLSRVSKRVADEAEERSKQLKTLSTSDVLNELILLYKQGIEPMQPTNFAKDCYELAKNAQKSINLATTEEGIIRKIRTLKPTFEKAKERGVKIRIMAPVNEKTQESLDKLKDIAEIKDIKNVNARFAIIDGEQILFMLMDDKTVHPTYDIGMWVNTPYFAGAMQNMFDMAWKQK